MGRAMQKDSSTCLTAAENHSHSETEPGRHPWSTEIPVEESIQRRRVCGIRYIGKKINRTDSPITASLSGFDSVLSQIRAEKTSFYNIYFHLILFLR